MSDIEITDIRVHFIEGPRPWVFVRVETNIGVTGFGEIPRMNHRPEDIMRIGQQLIGTDPFMTEKLFGSEGTLAAEPNNIFETTVLGGFDMACWDIKGKYLGAPLHELLGGKVRNEIRTYANGWDFAARRVVDRYHTGEDPEAVLSDTIDEITASVEAVVDAGYSACKFSPFQWGDGPTTSRLELNNAIEVTKSVYETVGPDVDILVEGHRHLTPGRAITASQLLEEFQPGFYEEPVPAQIDPLKKVSRQSSVPIATGEKFATHHAFAEILANTNVSVLQPDVGRAGGITELQKIAALASSNRVSFAPHNAAGPIMTHAAVHIDSVTPAFMIQETFEGFFHPEWSKDLFVESLTIDEGIIKVPNRPGLGFEIKESVLREHDITDEF